MSFNHTFIPQGGCCQWQPQLIGLHAIGDLLIALADYSIPAFLLLFARHRREEPLSKGLVLLGAWFFCDGTAHLMELVALGHPNYWGSGFLQALTGVISWLAIAEIAPLIPRFLAGFSPLRIAADNCASPNFIASIQTEKTVARPSENQLKTRLTAPIEISEKQSAEIARPPQVKQTILETSEILRATINQFEGAVKLNPIVGIGFWDTIGTITEASRTMADTAVPFPYN